MACLVSVVVLQLLTIHYIIVTGAQNSTTDTASPDGVGSATVISQFLASHNEARQQVGVPPLRWDAKLASFARAYANQRRGDCQLVHSPGYAYGENIFWGQGRGWAIPDAVAKWVEEKQWYRYDTNTCAGPDCTHYTQMVWRTTELLGCAKIVCSSGDTFIVCEYYPPGNYVGARPYIKPPKA
ncbi:pathogenesis-related protein PRMS-like [Musa acuminata AAA Group]|uniref:pathogenesis-related protein PRMS-like n=1 Tax=Musa acuminata AAA Group TaxID=214697 RepID=UPI0031DDD70E